MLNLGQRVGKFESTGLLQAVVLFLFLFPLFFQLSGTIFTAQDAFFDSQRSLLRLPLPIASVFCFLGIALFLRLGPGYFGTGFVFALFMLMMLSAVFSTRHGEGSVDLARFIHLTQLVLPSFALVLGALYIRPDAIGLRVEAIALYVLAIIIPLEVAATMTNGHALSSQLYFFSLYQHYQYLPVVFCGFYFLAAASFYQKSLLRNLVVMLAPCMGIYIAQSLSITTMLIAVYGAAVMLWILHKKNATRFALLLIVLALGAHLAYLPLVKGSSAYTAKFVQNESIEGFEARMELSQAEGSDSNAQDSVYLERLLQSFSINLKDRVSYWQFYFTEIFASPESVIFGHASRPDGNRYPSAHNYYLDLAYNFGMISLLPFLYLAVASLRGIKSVLTDKNCSADLVMLVALVAFFICIDNFFKVGLSQPYPGMMMFFLWGLLLARVGPGSSNPPGDTE